MRRVEHIMGFPISLLIIEWAASRKGCEVFAVDADRKVFRTPGLPVAAA